MNAITDKELAEFNGVEATVYEVAQAIQRHEEAFDDDDLSVISQEQSKEIIEALKDGDLCEVGHIYSMCRKQIIADRASISVYGRVGVITSSMVKS